MKLHPQDIGDLFQKVDEGTASVIELFAVQTYFTHYTAFAGREKTSTKEGIRVHKAKAAWDTVVEYEFQSHTRKGHAKLIVIGGSGLDIEDASSTWGCYPQVGMEFSGDSFNFARWLGIGKEDFMAARKNDGHKVSVDLFRIMRCPEWPAKTK